MQIASENILVIVPVKRNHLSDLFEIAGAFDRPRFFPRLVQRRQQHGGENRDDCNYN